MRIPDDVARLVSESKSQQHEAWLDLPYDICGEQVRQMTLNDYFILHGVESPFLTNEPFLPADIGIFLWLLSPKFKKCDKAREKFCEDIKDIKIAKAEEEINKYMYK